VKEINELPRECECLKSIERLNDLACVVGA